MFFLLALKEVALSRDPEELDVEFSPLGPSTLESILEKPDLVWGPLLGAYPFVYDWCQGPLGRLSLCADASTHIQVLSTCAPGE